MVLTTTPNGSNGVAQVPYYLINRHWHSLRSSLLHYAPTTSGANDYREPNVGAGTTAPVFRRGGDRSGAVPTPWNSDRMHCTSPTHELSERRQERRIAMAASSSPASASRAIGPGSAWQTQVEYEADHANPISGRGRELAHLRDFYWDGRPCNGAFFLVETDANDTYYGWVSSINSTATLNCPPLLKSDPRTSRFGVGTSASPQRSARMLT